MWHKDDKCVFYDSQNDRCVKIGRNVISDTCCYQRMRGDEKTIPMKMSNELETKLIMKYNKFINTEQGKIWMNSWKEKNKSDGDFGDFIYDFYPELLQ